VATDDELERVQEATECAAMDVDPHAINADHGRWAVSGNQKYYDLFAETTGDNWLSERDSEAVDAVVAAVREEFRRDADREQQRAAAAEKRAEQRGRQVAARDCLATLDYGEQAARLYARVAEGGT